MQIVTVTIPAGQSLSSSANLTNNKVAGILFPSQWTPANMSLQVSDDNVTFYDAYDNQGVEILRAVGPLRAVGLDPSLTETALYARLRSGPSINPVPQEAARDLKLLLVA